jgi:hypothetical protein
LDHVSLLKPQRWIIFILIPDCTTLERGEPNYRFLIVRGEIREHADAPRSLARLRVRRQRPCRRER